MSRIKTSPAKYAQGVERYGEDKFSALFMVDPEHCAHSNLTLRAKKTRQEHKGLVNYQVEETCQDCGDHSYRGFDVWGKP